jgi:lipopolysaccharide export system protein LptA
MTKKLLFAFTILLVVAFVAMAADITGKWVAEQPGRNGAPARQITFDLKADGATLTGTVTGGMGGGGRRGGGGGRQGGGAAPQPREISDGKIDGNNISFLVKVEFNGNTMVTKYEGTLSGDELKLKVSREGPNGPMTSEITAKRSTT